MKRFAPALLLAATLAAGLPAAAQPAQVGADEAGMKALRAGVAKDHRAVMQQHLPLTDAEATKFWPAYDAYLKELAELNRRQNRAIVDYVNTESTMSDAQAKAIARELGSVEEGEAKLRRTFFRKLDGILPGKKAARAMQIENKIRAVRLFDLAATFALVK